MKYYDKVDGLFNKFDAADLTGLNKEAKTFIVEKIPESGLIDSAKKEALDTILMIEQLLETSGWKLNYSQLVLPKVENKKFSYNKTKYTPELTVTSFLGQPMLGARVVF